MPGGAPVSMPAEQVGAARQAPSVAPHATIGAVVLQTFPLTEHFCPVKHPAPGPLASKAAL